jgi:hypothetical protein
MEIFESLWRRSFGLMNIILYCVTLHCSVLVAAEKKTPTPVQAMRHKNTKHKNTEERVGAILKKGEFVCTYLLFHHPGTG